MHRPLPTLLLALCLGLTACATDEADEPVPDASDEASTQESPDAAAATSPPDEEDEGDGTYTVADDVLYSTQGGVDRVLDVYTPTSEGPWPVVVAFHGADSNQEDGGDTRMMAEALATQGMLVYAPAWLANNDFPFTSAVMDAFGARVHCAVAFAQDHAAANGGDPSTTVVYGFSAGAGAGLIAAVDDLAAPFDGCEVQTADAAPTGAVLFDGEWFLHGPNFDPMFDQELEEAQAHVASLVDPAAWREDLAARFELSVAEQSVGERAFDDPATSEFLVTRDPDGSIRADLERLGQLEDGIISFVDAGELLDLRLSEAGFESNLTIFPGGHIVGNKVPELVEMVVSLTRG